MAITDLFKITSKGRILYMTQGGTFSPKHIPPGTLLNWKQSFLGKKSKTMYGLMHWIYQGETYEQAVARVKQDEAAKELEDVFHHQSRADRPARRQFSDVFPRNKGRGQEVSLRSLGRSLRPRVP